jgi:protein TonB
MKLAFLFLIAAAAFAQPGATTAPKIIHAAQPEYTAEARDAKLEGAVVVSAVIGVDGVPSEMKVVRGLGKGLDEKAIECAGKWRFKPASNYFGEPSPAKVTLEVNFRLIRVPEENKR